MCHSRPRRLWQAPTWQRAGPRLLREGANHSQNDNHPALSKSLRKGRQTWLEGWGKAEGANRTDKDKEGLMRTSNDEQRPTHNQDLPKTHQEHANFECLICISLWSVTAVKSHTPPFEQWAGLTQASHLNHVRSCPYGPP